VWPEAERLGIRFATMAWRFLPSFARIAEQHPQLKLIIDHLGAVRTDQDDAAFAKLPELVAIPRKYPNVAMKATGAPDLLHRSIPLPQHPRPSAPPV
jgi:predicted TIM-barrel fold metal-dependent hydrolase